MHFVVAETQQRDSYPQCFTTEIFGREKAKESRRDLGSCHRVISLLGWISWVLLEIPQFSSMNNSGYPNFPKKMSEMEEKVEVLQKEPKTENPRLQNFIEVTFRIVK